MPTSDLWPPRVLLPRCTTVLEGCPHTPHSTADMRLWQLPASRRAGAAQLPRRRALSAAAAGPRAQDIAAPQAIAPFTLALAEGILAQDRTSLSRAITLIESTTLKDGVQSRLLLQHLHAALVGRGKRVESFRIGLCGPPGVGKSSLVETLGKWLLAGEDNPSGDRTPAVSTTA